MNKAKIFKHQLLKWSNKNTRKYSWRNSDDPWKILLLEIIAQQTQLDRANIYYEKFIKRFPTPKEMSNATKKEVLSLWSGLGYNSRALRLYETSKILSKKSFNSIYPNFDVLPGVGKYTKSALLSFAYEEKVIAQDTNVIRIFSRFFGIENPQNFIEKNEKNILKNIKSRKFNQILMDFGSKICTSRNPLCAECVLEANCKKFFSSSKYTPVPFKGSNREIRGKIIKFLVVNESVEISSLKKSLKIEDYKIESIIKKLADEGMINIKNKKLIEISS
tara:strand:+ start:1139 stop:1966 length:828 start_codon:yes stop_codon:yes gene_type:complete